MLVTRVVVEAPVVSFRYPHFLVGRQPTYELPPLSTLYGHLCSAVGEWTTVEELRVGFHFTAAARGEDLEHQTIIARSSGKLPGTIWPKVTEGTVQPTRREFLFDACLTLYVAGDWVDHFRSPRYAVVLGRSQDLASYRSVQRVELQEVEHVYYEHTLLPWSLRPVVTRGRAETMPRWIDYSDRRRAYFDRFLVMKEPVFTHTPEHWMQMPGGPTTHWADTDSPERAGVRRGVWMHSLCGDEQ